VHIYESNYAFLLVHDSSVFPECILLLSKVMLSGQPVSMTIEVADLVSMR
jgi:hypothetical protein